MLNIRVAGIKDACMFRCAAVGGALSDGQVDDCRGDVGTTDTESVLAIVLVLLSCPGTGMETA